MSILRSLMLACTLALACGTAASLLVLLALDGLTKLSRRTHADAPVSVLALPTGRSAAPAVLTRHQVDGHAGSPRIALAP